MLLYIYENSCPAVRLLFYIFIVSLYYCKSYTIYYKCKINKSNNKQYSLIGVLLQATLQHGPLPLPLAMSKHENKYSFRQLSVWKRINLSPRQLTTVEDEIWKTKNPI